MFRFLLFTIVFSGVPVLAAPYKMADLEVLVKENSFLEFFDHALDIRPSERQGIWQDLVTKAASSYTEGLIHKNPVEKAHFMRVEELYSWPTLRKDDLFRSRRHEIGLRYLKKCLNESPPCLSELTSFWEKDKTDPDVAFKLAQLIHKLSDPPFSTWDLLSVALKSPLSEFYCKDNLTMGHLWKKIGLQYVSLDPKGDLMHKIDQIIHPDCMPSLLKEADKRLYSPSHALDREVAFAVLKSQMKDSLALSDFFYTVYLLDNPSQGETFNYSWNRIKDLGNNVARRLSVLSKLKSLDPLPDALLGSLDERKKKAVLNHFKVFFPEYLELYTEKCIQFYSGTASFPAGNPTVHCQNFMNSDLASEIVEENKIKKFQDAKRI